MDSNDGEVSIRLDAGLQERVAAYAAREGLTVGESLSALLYLGLECSPCDYVHCVWPEGQKYQCMVRQDTDAIVQAAEELLARS